jgi:hypothetical protein
MDLCSESRDFRLCLEPKSHLAFILLGRDGETIDIVLGCPL